MNRYISKEELWMKKPIIALTPMFDDSLNSLTMLPEYLDAVYAAGGLPVILPLDMEEDDICLLASNFDGFLIPGGHDVDPALYGEKKLDFCGEPNRKRDFLESIIFREALKHDKPVLAICRGFQFINAVSGGSLYQDITQQLDPDVKVRHRQEEPYDIPCHTVEILPGNLLHSIVEADRLEVNSLHHQAVKALAPVFKACAAAEDGIVEAAFMPSKKFVLGIQWHAEFLYKKDRTNLDIFAKFVDAAR
jgi:putative glutamine amidotransferase